MSSASIYIHLQKTFLCILSKCIYIYSACTVSIIYIKYTLKMVNVIHRKYILCILFNFPLKIFISSANQILKEFWSIYVGNFCSLNVFFTHILLSFVNECFCYFVSICLTTTLLSVNSFCHLHHIVIIIKQYTCKS